MCNCYFSQKLKFSGESPAKGVAFLLIIMVNELIQAIEDKHACFKLKENRSKIIIVIFLELGIRMDNSQLRTYKIFKNYSNLGWFLISWSRVGLTVMVI